MDAALEDSAADEPIKQVRSRTRGAFAWILRGVGVVLALLLLAVVLLNTPIGQRLIADQIAKIAPASGLRFEIGRIEGDIYGKSTLHDLTVYDPKGKFLTIPEVELEWRPLSWLTSGIDVRNLVARRGNLLRLPELLPGDPDAPILPDFDIRVDRFEIDSLTLAPGIAGDSSPIVNLLAQADIRSGKVYLKAEGDLGDRDRLFALIDAEPDGDRFDMKIDYHAPLGGVLAGLVGAKSDYSIKLAGDGSWTAWDGYVLAKRAQESFAAFKLANRGGTYRVVGQFDPSPIVAGLAAKALGSKVSLDARGTLVDSELDGHFAMAGSAINGRGAGAIDLADNNFDAFNIKARLTDPALLGEGFRLEGAELSAVFDGDFRDLSVAHDLSIDRLVAGQTLVSTISQQGTARYDGVRWTLPLRVKLASIVTGTDWADSKLANGVVAGKLVYQGDKLLSDDLGITFKDADAKLALRGDIAAGTYQLTGPINAKGVTLDNLGVLNGNAKVDWLLDGTGNWTLRSNFAARLPVVTNTTLADLAGPDISLKGGLSLGSNTPLDFTKVSVTAAKLSVLLDGTIRQGTTSLAGSGSHTDYGPFSVEATLGDAGPTANLVFASPLPAAGLKDVHLAISPNANGFDIGTSGQSLLGDFAGDLALNSSQNGPAQIEIDALRVWKTNVTGRLTLEDGGATGGLKLSGGGLDGTIGLATRGGGQGFVFDVDASQTRFGGATPISIARASLEGRGYLKDGNSTLSSSMTAQGLTYGTLFVGRMAAAANLENGQGTATASLAGRRGSRFAMQFAADIAPDRYAITGRGEFAGERILMPRRAVLTRQADQGWRIAPTQISYGKGAVVVSGEVGGGTTALDLALDKMPLSLVDLAFADIGLGGTISGKVDFRRGGGAMPVGNARVKIDNLTRSGLVLSSRPIDLSLVSTLTANALELRAVFDEGGERRGRVQARISGLAQSGTLDARLGKGKLAGQLRYGGPAAALWRLAGVEGFDLTGPVSVAADVSGSFSDPSVSGSLASDDLRLRSSLSGTDISGVRVRGRFAGSRLRLTEFSGKADNGGTVSGSGIVDLQDIGKNSPKLDIRIAAKNARLLNASGLDATITGPLRIISDGNGGTIAGRVEIDRASWKLGSAETVAALPQINTREKNLPPDIAPTRIRTRKWSYLIDARARSRINVDGMGLDSEWRGDIKLRGTTQDPRIGGEARVVRGFYSFAGTRFELSRGRIAFDETVAIDPRLDIIAETESDGLNVIATVQGSALNPEISFSSDPALPEEEVLARLLFGGSITELSATDALQLGTALASLRGGSGLDPINKLRSAIGLDRLRIVSADPALGRATGVALGKNVGRRFYVEIVTDGRGYSATTTEFKITSWLSLLASVSTVGRDSVVAEVRRDY